MRNLWQDLRYCVRTYSKKPVFTLTIIITLALGIGANTAIFSVVNAVLLRPLPYRAPEELLLVRHFDKKNGKKLNSVSHADFEDWRAKNHIFDDMALFKGARFRLDVGNDVMIVSGANVSYNFFQLLGVNILRGRTFLPAEDTGGAGNVAVISQSLWKKSFSADEKLVGNQIKANGQMFTVVGILPPDFKFPFAPENADIWTTNSIFSAAMMERGARNFQVIARLKPGVSLNAAQTEMTDLVGQLEQEYMGTNRNLGVVLISIHDELTKDVRLALWLLLGAVGFVLMIACANVTNLLLASALSRRKELAVRAVLGANRWRIIRQLMVESLLLSLGGGLVGAVVAGWGIPLLLVISPRNLPRVNDIGMNTQVLGFTILISVLTGIVICLALALKVTRSNLTEALKESHKTSFSKVLRNWSRTILVVTEIAFAMILLIGAALHINSFIRLSRVELGFNPENIIYVGLNFSPPRYIDGRERVAFIRQLRESVEKLPGVQAVGFASSFPLRGDEDSSVDIKGRKRSATETLPLIRVITITPEYFRLMRIPLLQGRDFLETDDKGGKGVAIVNEVFAKQYFPNVSPLGQSVIPLTNRDKDSPPEFEIVGVIGNIRSAGPDKEPKPEIYTPYWQTPWTYGSLLIHTRQNAQDMIAAVRQQVRVVDPEQTVPTPNTFENLLSAYSRSQRFNMLLLSIFAAVGLLLTLVGIYGVISFLVSENTHEIGIRRALGAQQSDILKLVIGRGLVIVLTGIAIGTGGALGLTRFMTSLLFDITATDPVTFVIVAVLFVVTGMIACYLPARRAMKVDPMIALQYKH